MAKSGRCNSLKLHVTPFMSKSLISVGPSGVFFGKFYSVFVSNPDGLPKNHLFSHLASRGLATLDIADCSPNHIPPGIGLAPQILHSRQ